MVVTRGMETEVTRGMEIVVTRGMDRGYTGGWRWWKHGGIEVR